MTAAIILTGLIAGVLDGAAAVGVYVIRGVVLPLSRVQMAATTTWNSIIVGALVLVVCIGFPISLGARRYFSQHGAR